MELSLIKGILIHKTCFKNLFSSFTMSRKQFVAYFVYIDKITLTISVFTYTVLKMYKIEYERYWKICIYNMITGQKQIKGKLEKKSKIGKDV